MGTVLGTHEGIERSRTRINRERMDGIISICQSKPGSDGRLIFLQFRSEIGSKRLPSNQLMKKKTTRTK